MYRRDLTISSVMGPKINARQERHVGALGNTLADGGERRRPMLPRQNKKGNIAPSSPKFWPPPKVFPLTSLILTQP